MTGKLKYDSLGPFLRTMSKNSIFCEESSSKILSKKKKKELTVAGPDKIHAATAYSRSRRAVYVLYVVVQAAFLQPQHAPYKIGISCICSV